MHELTDAFVKTQRDLGIQLSRVSELPDALGLVLEAAVRIEGIDGGGVYTVDRQAGEVRLLADRGLSPRFVRQVLRYPLSSPVSRRAMRGRPIYRDAAYTAANAVFRKEGLRAIAAIPIRHHRRVIAVLNLASRSVDRIPDAARTALEAIATQLGSVLPRIAAETEVREQQARLRALFDATPDIAALLDRSGRLVALNEACSRSLGLDRTAAIGLDVFRLLDSAASRRRRAMMRAVLTQGRPVAFSDQRDGRWFDNRMFPVRDDQGRVTGAAVFARDVTEIRGLEQQIVRVSEFEKQRIGRDLHDNLMQQLAGVSFLSAALARRLSGSDPACAQEAVGNAVRHGRPSRVDVTLGIRGSRCTLRVTDDGAGIAAAPPGSGLGVKIMRYRANLLGGQLTITPGRRSGTVVACRFEVPAPA